MISLAKNTTGQMPVCHEQIKFLEENKLQKKTYDIVFIHQITLSFPPITDWMKSTSLQTNNRLEVNPEGHQILRNIYEPLPLGGPPGQVSIQPQFFFNRDLDYLLTGDKERRIALSISKLKAARYLDFGLEELVPSLWVESEREYDISAVYGITHLCVYGGMNSYSQTQEIILRRADYQEYKISEKDFKNLHPNDFEDLFLLNIQEKLNHLPKTDKTSLHTAVNMWIRNLNGVWKSWTKWVKDFPSVRVQIRAWRPGIGHRMTRERSKDSSQLPRKTTDQRIYRIWNLCWRKKHPSENIVFHNEDGNPARANIKQALGYRKDGDRDGKSEFLRFQIMPPRKAPRTRTTPAITTTTTSVTNTQLQEMINQGVTAALAVRDANRNGDNSHSSGTEYAKVEVMSGWFPDMIHESVMASKPKTMQEATEMATELMDKKISTLTECASCTQWAQYCKLTAGMQEDSPREARDCRITAAASNKRTLTYAMKWESKSLHD
ncbi:hypothetical protein Tco_1399753 [Tanacetum coccineum]